MGFEPLETKRPSLEGSFSPEEEAEGKGFEPLSTDPESVVLPLDEPSVPAGGILPCRKDFRLVPLVRTIFGDQIPQPHDPFFDFQERTADIAQANVLL